MLYPLNGQEPMGQDFAHHSLPMTSMSAPSEVHAIETGVPIPGELPIPQAVGQECSACEAAGEEAF